MKITDLLGEATEYDKKQAVEHKKVKSWLKSVSAFANTAGGTLIFGITLVLQMVKKLLDWKILNPILNLLARKSKKEFHHFQKL